LAVGCLPFALGVALLGRPHLAGQRANQPGQGQAMVLNGHRLPVQALAFGPDGATLTSAACRFRATKAGVEVATWDVGTGSPVAKRTEYPGAPLYLAFAPGGRTLVAAIEDRALLMWDVAPWRERQLLDGPRPFAGVLAISDDGARLATIDYNNGVMLWDVSGGRPSACCTGHGGLVASLAFAPDGRTLAIGGADATVRLWDVATGAERGDLRGHAHVVAGMAFAPDGRTLASGDLRGIVRLWDVAALTERATLKTADDEGFLNEVAALAFSPDGRTLAVTADRAVQLWDVATARLLASLEGHEKKVICLAYSSDGTRLASGSYDTTVRLWDVARYRPLRP
jgi:WD40 repeat protein